MDDSKSYRERAKRARERAAATRDYRAKMAWLEIAKQYECLAELAERSFADSYKSK